LHWILLEIPIPIPDLYHKWSSAQYRLFDVYFAIKKLHLSICFNVFQ
jgi:hypothetical protein